MGLISEDWSRTLIQILDNRDIFQRKMAISWNVLRRSAV